MSETFSYIFSGLRVESDFPIPELVACPETETSLQLVRICRGVVPVELENPAQRGVLYQASPGQFLLTMPGLARYLAQNGEQIVVEYLAEDRDSEVRLFLLGSVWAALLHQRSLLVLHASAVVTPQGAILFLGRSSTGKSSLAAALYQQKGFPVLADDLVALRIEQGQAWALPGFPHLHLWPDILVQLGIPPEAVTRPRPGLPKRAWPTPDGFRSDPQPVRALYLLTTHMENDFVVEQVQGMKRFSTLLHNTFRERFLGGLGLRPVHFQQVSALARQLPLTILTRPDASADFARFIALVG